MGQTLYLVLDAVEEELSGDGSGGEGACRNDIGREPVDGGRGLLEHTPE
jgi:hypothetical protein